MKLLIDEPIHWAETNDPSITEDELSDLYEQSVELQEVCDKFCVYCTIDFNESSNSVTLYPQKIVLDEVNMNELFSDVIFPVFGQVKLEYSPLGGAGCDFAIRLLPSKRAAY